MSREDYLTGFNEAKAKYEHDLYIAVETLKAIHDIIELSEYSKDHSRTPIDVNVPRLGELVKLALSKLFIRR